MEILSFISDGVHDIHPSVSMFFVVLFQTVISGNILVIFGVNGMEEGYSLPLLSTTITGAFSYHSLEEEGGDLLLRGKIE